MTEQPTTATEPPVCTKEWCRWYGRLHGKARQQDGSALRLIEWLADSLDGLLDHRPQVGASKLFRAAASNAFSASRRARKFLAALPPSAPPALDVGYTDLEQMEAMGWPATSHEYRRGYRAALARLQEQDR